MLAARALDDPTDRPPGHIQVDLTQRETPLKVATGRGWLVPDRLQRAGGRALATADFLRGRPIEDGSELG